MYGPIPMRLSLFMRYPRRVGSEMCLLEDGAEFPAKISSGEIDSLKGETAYTDILTSRSVGNDLKSFDLKS